MGFRPSLCQGLDGARVAAVSAIGGLPEHQLDGQDGRAGLGLVAVMRSSSSRVMAAPSSGMGCRTVVSGRLLLGRGGDVVEADHGHVVAHPAPLALERGTDHAEGGQVGGGEDRVHVGPRDRRRFAASYPPAAVKSPTETRVSS